MFPEIQADVETLITILKIRGVEGADRRRLVKHEGKMRYIHGSRHEKSRIMPFAATWMDLEIITLSEVSHTKTNII